MWILVLKIWRPKLLKIAVLEHLTVVWGLLATEPPRIFAWTLHCIKVQSLGYICCRQYWTTLFQIFVVSSEKQLCAVSAVQPFKVIQSRWFEDQLKARRYDFLLVINSNIGLTSHRFRDTATNLSKTANFSYPSLIYRAPSRWPLSNFRKTFTDPKTIVCSGADCSEDFVSVTAECDRHTDTHIPLW